MNTIITVKKNRTVATTNNSMFKGVAAFKTRSQARIVAAKMKAEGFKVLNPTNGANGWQVPHKGGTLSLNSH